MQEKLIEHVFNNNGIDFAAANVLRGDSEVFGFPVGEINFFGATTSLIASSIIREWVQRSGCEVTVASVAASDLIFIHSLQKAGFVNIDTSLQANIINLKRRPTAIKPGAVRTCQEKDFAGVESIASTAFEFGRYHRDARFPRSLADKRFAVWVKQRLHTPKTGQHFFVMGEVGAPVAFMLVEVQGGHAHFQLGGVSREASNGLLGPFFFSGVLAKLEQDGVRSVKAKISAANTPVLNIYSALGFQTSKPEFTLHYHMESSSHLISI
jgi:hypothetical protein